MVKEVKTISGAALVVLIVVAALCGGIRKTLAGGARGGWITSMALGFVGAAVGTWTAGQFRLPEPFVLQTSTRAAPDRAPAWGFRFAPVSRRLRFELAFSGRGRPMMPEGRSVRRYAGPRRPVCGRSSRHALP